MEIVNAKEYNNNPGLHMTVAPENDLKNFLVEYVGEQLGPDDNNVTVEMIVDVMAREFPEFLLAVAEENWVRGYQQAIQDVDDGIRLKKENDNECRKNCKLSKKTE